MSEEPVRSAARSLTALIGAAERLAPAAPAAEELAAVGRRGYFRPAEEERLLAWFARFLSVRQGMWEVVGDMGSRLGGSLAGIADDGGRSAFVLAYAAGCSIVGLDRLLVDEVATLSSVQRKLNEGAPQRRIPRKQFTAVFESLSDPQKALLLQQAMRWRDRHEAEIARLGADPVVGELVRELPRLERSLDRSRRRFARILGGYLRHSLRRRGASARQRTAFAVLESSGRLVSELGTRPPRRVTAAVRDRLAGLLIPGYVLVTRREGALTNLFLPGYWPHAALHVGSEDDRRRLGVELDEERAGRWIEPRRVLEALKDGVLFRPLSETLEVDAVAVLRPRLDRATVARAIARAARHEGKLYNFDFDFFRSDRLVCTEVVYRAYDGLPGVSIPLRERAGRPTLSAEDLLDLALGDGPFAPVAVFGAPSCPTELFSGEKVAPLLAASLRESRRG